uniref:WYL domain-containing protein n=1 Tax=Desulfacinum infernum TaxID=35837 RepID=A0A831ZYI8_9BACT
MSIGSYQQLGKLLKLVDCLARRQGAGIKDIQKALSCDERTAYRWLATLDSLGFPVEDLEACDGQCRKRYRLIDTYVKKLPNISIPNFSPSKSDIIFMYVALSQDRLTWGTQMKKRIDNLLKRLAAALPLEDQKLAEALSRLTIPNPRPQKDYSSKEGIIDGLTRAILEKKRCWIQYYSFSKRKDTAFLIHPLHFFESQGGLYVMVQLVEMKEPVRDVSETLRVLAVERIQKIAVLGDTFDYPEGVNARDLLAQAFDTVWNQPIKVKVWFSERAAPYVKERVWPGKYKIEENGDGSIIFHLKTSGHGDVKRWILSFGNDARVIKPLSLKKDIKKTILGMAKMYSNNTNHASPNSKQKGSTTRGKISRKGRPRSTATV